ncbi:hypothetical protein CMUS01_12659 [Colletotrichum musicola]|uniref:Uncharacterized protein n=1 Tax=Colletotrichum musicola TaxID=2175873 RepID=A0A8H6JJF6_9PEZI|nr:hypothetical protein CMUS01_12659 [Colletotrichum musicola]
MSSDPNTRQSHFSMGDYRPFENQSGPGTVPVPYNRRWHIAKIVIRGFGIAFAIIVIGFSTYMASSLARGAFHVVLSGFPAIASVIWDTSELITTCARGGRKGIHPGAHVALHLLFWLVFAVAVGIQSTLIYFRDADDDGYYANPADVVTAFTALLFIGHFALFVRACMETNERNRRPPVFMVPVNAPLPTSQITGGSYRPYPHPNPMSTPAQQEKVLVSSANAAVEGTSTPPGPDGTYYGPSSQSR